MKMGGAWSMGSMKPPAKPRHEVLLEAVDVVDSLDITTNERGNEQCG